MKLCPICRHKQKLAFKKLSYPIYKCPNCDLYITHLKNSYHQVIKNYYTQGYFTGKKNKAGYANYQQDHQVVRRNALSYIDLLSKHKTNGKLLDVGCATGIFLEEAQKKGFKPHGIDVSEYAVKIAQKKFKQKVKKGTLPNKKFLNYSFDVITLFDVFEHLDKPNKQLATYKKLLKKNGLIFIVTGNTDSLLSKIQKQNWHFFIPPQHVYFYSLKNLTTLLSSHGFKIIHTSNVGKHLSIRYLLHLMRTINKSPLANFLYSISNKTLLAKIPFYINLHDNMAIIAKKT